MTATSESSTPALLDTNIVVYAYDVDEPAKHQVARELLERLVDEGRLVLSVQVFNESCAVMLKSRRGARLESSQVCETLRGLEACCAILPMTATLTLRALEVMPREGLSFWDALIWAAAAEHRVPTIYTEDFQDGRVIEGVRFVNPFTTT